MVSSKFKLFAVSVLLAGAATYAYACGDDNKSSSNSSASLASTSGSSCASKAASAGCGSKSKSSSTAASFAAAAGGDHCGSSSKSAAVAECVYGENTVTMAGACPAKGEADYSFAIAGAECKGTGAAAAKAIKSVKGVASVTVDYDKHMAYVCADSKSADKKAIAKSLKAAGFDEVKFVSATKANCAKSHGKVDAS